MLDAPRQAAQNPRLANPAAGMKSTVAQSGIILVFAAFTVCCMRPSAIPAGSGSTNKILGPDSGNADSAQAANETGWDDELVGLLKEQNKRLKAQVERLEKENAELKAKMAQKQ